MNDKIKYPIFLLAISLSVQMGATNAMAQEVPGSIEDDPQETTAYEKSDILHAFSVMEKHISIDEDYHFDIDMVSARSDLNVGELDIQISQSYALYNDRLMDVVGPVGQVNELETDMDKQIHDLVTDFESGEFRKLFSDGSEGHVGTVLNVMHITLDSKITPIHHGSWPTWCGGNFLDPHIPDPTPTTYNAGDSLSDTQQILRDNGYHMTSEYASWNGATSQPYDFTKVVPSSDYGGLCDGGAFRDHAGINHNFSYTVQNEEPNPEVLSYLWPYSHWGVYVLWWHDNY